MYSVYIEGVMFAEYLWGGGGGMGEGDANSGMDSRKEFEVGYY